MAAQDIGTNYKALSCQVKIYNRSWFYFHWIPLCYIIEFPILPTLLGYSNFEQKSLGLTDNASFWIGFSRNLFTVERGIRLFSAED